MTKIGLDDYNFNDELINNDDDGVEIISEDEKNDVDDEAEKKLN